jgi:hypothetical protein
VDQFQAAAQFSLREDAAAQLAPGIAALKAAYGLQAETELLQQAFGRIGELAAAQGPVVRPAAVEAVAA